MMALEVTKIKCIEKISKIQNKYTPDNSKKLKEIPKHEINWEYDFENPI